MKLKNLNINVLATIILVIIFTVSLALHGFSKGNPQTPGYLEVFGKIRSAAIVPQNLLITVFKDGVKKEEYVPDETGRFDIKLPLNGTYYLHVTGYTMISKTVEIRTTVPDEFWYCEYEYKFNMNLTGGYQPEPVERLKQPVVKIAYNPVYDGFDYDREYNKEVKDLLILSQVIN